MTHHEVLQVIQDCFDSLMRTKVVEQKFNVTSETVLLGNGSVLDSLGFVTFVSDMEDRLARQTGKDIYFVLSDILDFNINTPFLSVGTFTHYVTNLVGSG